MTIDPYSTVITSKELVQIAEAFSEKIPTPQKKNSLRIECSNGIGVHTSHFNIDGRISKWIQGLTHGTMVIPASKVYSVKTVGYSPFPDTIHGNVKQDGDRIIIDLKPALKFDLFSIEIAYKMDDMFLRNLVRARAPSEVFGDVTKYKLSAQLKNPEGLQLGFSEIEIEEFPVSARVHLTERIYSHVPDYLKDLIEIDAELLNDRNPHRDKRRRELDQERVRLLRKLNKATLEEKIQDLAQLLTDAHFIKYFRIVEDFSLDRCEKSTEFFRALGMFQLPKFMNVISKADLNLKKPAAKGILIYDSKRFEDEIENLF